jgi:hypothetical protein
MRFIKPVLAALAISLLLAQVSVAQEMHAKLIPYFRSLNPATLGPRITRGAKSDSEKVRLIHDWIASNIKYDVKKWYSHNYEEVPLKKILWRRKAICLGYSELFASLCFYAGINCVIVPGYAKDIYVTQGDNFYFDEHTWNAVHIEGGWKLVDVCWDAGVIVPTKRTFKGFFIYLFSGNKEDDRTYSPHFAKKAREFYCMNDGSLFRTDHLPLNSIWQLQSPQQTVQQFIADSSYYYKQYNNGGSSDMSADNESARISFLNKSDRDKQLENAIAGYKYNHNNHFEACIAEYDKACDILPLMTKGADTTGMRLICDSALTALNRSLAHCDSMRTVIQKQKKELTLISKKKKNTLLKQNTALISSTKIVLKGLQQYRSIAYQNGKQLSSVISNRNSQLKSAIKSNVFYNKKNAVTSSRADSIGYVISLRILSDSIKKEQKYFDGLFGQAEVFYSGIENRLTPYAEALPGIIASDKQINGLRINNFDDLDYELRNPKDQLIHSKYKNDSLLFKKKSFVFAPLFDEINKLKTESTIVMNSYKIKLQLLQQYKSVCMNSTGIDEQYKATLDDLSAETSLMNTEENALANQFLKLGDKLTITSEEAQKEQNAYQAEKKTEQYFSNVRIRYINSHASGLMNTAKDLKKLCRSAQRDVSHYMRRLPKKKQ